MMLVSYWTKYIKVLSLVSVCLTLLTDDVTSTCGYQSCDTGKPDMLNVHIVSHTHDDVGWLKTVDQYFYGARNDIQNAGVQYIIDTVIQQIYNDPARRFIYVEMAYFYRWWNEQNTQVQNIVKELVNNGTLQFILGGWSMNDEASTHYVDIIDQHTAGLQFLNKTFGECGRPLVAWQIDPFGHSQEQASLFAQMGYDGLYFMRLDYQDKQNRLNKKTMEFVWQGSKDLGSESNLFTGALYDSYCPPGGFCFDDKCGDTPIMDDSRLHDYNVDQRIDDFLKYVNQQAQHFTTNHIMIPMGCDFQYQNARMWFVNLDKLIRYTNERQANGSKVNVLYSTPSCYTYAVNKAQKTYTVKTDDFFPYADSSNSFWTGYFTSRAALKFYVRQASNFLQACKQFSVLGEINPAQTQPYVDKFRQVMGVAQHHDAVSGTEKQQVAFDYAQRISEGVHACMKAINLNIQKTLGISSSFDLCPLLNISLCDYWNGTGNIQTMITIYNPSSLTRSHWVRLPVFSGFTYTVTNASGSRLPFDLLSVTNRTISIPERGKASGLPDQELLFDATNIPAFGIASFSLAGAKTNRHHHKYPPNHHKLPDSPPGWNMQQSGDIVIGNNVIQLTFDSLTGLTSKLQNLRTGAAILLAQSIQYYDGFQSIVTRPSGAYIFRPAQQQANSFNYAKITNVVKSQFVQEVHQEFAPWATQVIRIYSNKVYVEVEWTVGPIPNNDAIGREVILHYRTNLTTNGKFYTDANGRQVLQRIRNFRPTWNLTQTEPVAGNYYPVNSRIFIKDETAPSQDTQTNFVVLTDRSQGGGSIRDGEIEVMVHRRTIQDDSLGVGEPLNELGSDKQGLVVRGKHFLYVSFHDDATLFHRVGSTELFFEPILFTNNKWLMNTPSAPLSFLATEVPVNLQILTLENWDDASVLLRIEHIFQTGEHPVYSKPATLNLQNLFKNFQISNYSVLSLAALGKHQRLHWQTSTSQMSPKRRFKSWNSRHYNNAAVITLNPMEIITMQVFLK